VHIRLKRLRNLVSLDMSRNNFSSVPVAIFGLPWLQYLDLSHNKLCSADCNFPAWLTSIRTVILDHNLLVDLPTWWIQAPTLTKLSINFNSLQPLNEKIQ
jgi:Leucine-rich repeat (LRR) protein